ncbi:acetyltransferase [Sphingorhabdus sp.]|uniref:acetyltransferase n=1 Tax=Sphingorhabdus sp. TaxID=1902408 RepID=UPI0035B39A43
MKPASLILIGAGGHARACIDVIEQGCDYRIAGLVGVSGEIGSVQCGHVVIASDEGLEQLRAQHDLAFIGVGHIRSPQLRIRLFARLLELGFCLPTLVSPTAYVSPYATIGPGSIVMHGAIVNAGATIGSNCIINSCALVEHDVRIGDHCHLSTGAILNGEVVLGDGSFVGSASVVKEGLSIPAGSLLGMGSVVRKVA